jgi:hypothetical protein
MANGYYHGSKRQRVTKWLRFTKRVTQSKCIGLAKRFS